MKDHRPFVVQLIFKNASIFIPIPTIFRTDVNVCVLSFPNNLTDQSKDLVFVIENYDALLKDNQRFVFNCLSHDDIHSACVIVEFFYKLGWRTFHQSSWACNDGYGQRGYIVSHPLVEKNHKEFKNLRFDVSIISKLGTSLLLESYDSLRIPTGYVHPHSILASVIIDKSWYPPNKKILQFFFDAQCEGRNFVDLAFTDLNDKSLLPFHDYLIQEIGRGLTIPWTNEKIRKTIVDFLEGVPNRYKNFEIYITQLYSAIGKPLIAQKYLDLLLNNLFHQNGIPFEEKNLVSDDAEDWWCICRLNSKNYKKNELDL